MKFINYLLVLLLLSSCSSKITSFYVVDEDKIDFATFSFYAREKQNLNKQKAQLDSTIERTISEQMLKKGYSYASFSDVYISYKIMSDRAFNAHTQSSYDPLLTNSYNMHNYDYQYVTEHKEGVLIIDIYDKNDKLLWQGSKAFKVGKGTDTRTLLIKYLELIMAAFKPKL